MTATSSSPAALITGGTAGIGHATARVLHADGYGVLVTGRNPDTLAAARRTLPDEVAVLRADLRSIADAKRGTQRLTAISRSTRDSFSGLRTT
jgi:NADP-dependent 3-hydroxy acid dehydrogenase YdfG